MSLRNPKPCTAISRRGVCCFIDAIRSISCQADMLCRIHVIAGHIHYKKRSYESVFDGNLPWDKAWTIAERALTAAEKDPAQTEESLDSIPDTIITVPDITKIQALAAEACSGSTIVCSYRVFTSKSSLLVPPGKITECVLDRTGLIGSLQWSRLQSSSRIPLFRRARRLAGSTGSSTKSHIFISSGLLFVDVPR